MLLFKKVMDNIVDFYKNNCKNKNTTKATNSWLRTYKLWAENNNQILEIHTIESTVDLNNVLELFFSSVTRINGKEYEPVSLCALRAAIDRHLKDMGSMPQIFKDLEFCGSRNMLVNAINILTHGFGCNIDLFFSFFLFSELFGTRAYTLVQITQKIKKT